MIVSLSERVRVVLLQLWTWRHQPTAFDWDATVTMTTFAVYTGLKGDHHDSK